MRRYAIIILLLLNGFNLDGQVDCYSIPVVMSTEEDSLMQMKPQTIALFSQIDLSGQSSISFIYEKVMGEISEEFYSTDIQVLRNLANKYSDAEVVKDSLCALDTSDNNALTSFSDLLTRE